MAKKPKIIDRLKIKILLDEADELYDSKEFKAAISNYDKAIKLDPKDPIAWNNRGAAKDDLGQFEEAIKDYDKSIELDSENAIVWNNRGVSKNILGQYESAIRDYDKAIELDSKYAIAWKNRGAVKNDLGQHEEAIENFDKVIALDPKDSTAWNNRGVAKEDLGKHREAIKDYDKAIELDSEYAAAWNNRGAAKNLLGEHEEAFKDIDKSIELDPENPIAWNNRGYAKSGQDRYEEAIKDYDEAIKLDPEYASAWSNRADAKKELGHLEEAVKDVEHAFKLDPESANIRNNYAAIMAESEVRSVVEERIGKLGNALEDITNERNKLESDYTRITTQRDRAVKYLIGIVLLFFLIPVVVIILFICDIELCQYEFCFTDLTINWNIFYYWYAAMFIASAPFLIFLRLKSRDAEEAKVLSHDYLRMMAIEARLNVYQGYLPKEQSNALIEKQIDNWMGNSPANTLLELKNKNADTAMRHPIENAIKNLKEMIGKDKQKAE